MDATKPLRCGLVLILAVGTIIGCQADSHVVRSRAQMPTDPLAPILPPPPPHVGGVNAVASPSADVVAESSAVIGQPITPTKTDDVVPASWSGLKPLPTVAELIKNSTPRVRVVAVVGQNNVITDKEVMESVWQQYRELAFLDGPAREAKQRELYNQSLRRLIERELILDELSTKLRKAGKTQVLDELREAAVEATDRQIREIRKMFKLESDEEFATWLRIQALTLPVLRRQLERQFMAQQFIQSMLKEKGRRISLGEIRDYYDKHPEEFRVPDRVKWQHIFISSARHPSPQAAHEHATAILKAAHSGADFAELSKRYDNGSAAGQGGFGLGEKVGEILPADIAPTVWSLQPGQISGIITTPTGYHIVKVVERDYAGILPFDQKVQAQIRDKLTEAQTAAEMKKLIDELWRKGVVRIIHE
ncbi:MAG: peptidyl-prolyl cis-trans isomerase [Gemmataceae bacterium]|nr:peptidyl-prolyl cis-trans isomerase [Gemmata sp.]MDW8199079.1 peptidyl-prolyl cis-trans isomerase [Gemmataceae bacterium]